MLLSHTLAVGKKRAAVASSPPRVPLVASGGGGGAHKWDSAGLELIIMPRLSLTDAGNLNSVTQTCISLSVCVCVYLYKGHARHPSLSTAEV